MSDLRRYIEIVEGQHLAEQARAPLYHATGITAALGILTSGEFSVQQDHGRLFDGIAKLCVSRDERYRFSGGGYMDKDGNTVVEIGEGPIQFVLDQDAIRSRYKVEPYDMATGRFRAWPDAEEDEHDPWGNWSFSGNSRRKESEERIHLPKSGKMPIDGIVKAIILEPVSLDWLRMHHAEGDREHFIGSGEEKEFPYTRKASGIRHNDAVEPITKNWGNDYKAVDPKVYHRIILLAKRRGIPVIDRRKGK